MVDGGTLSGEARFSIALSGAAIADAGGGLSSRLPERIVRSAGAAWLAPSVAATLSLPLSNGANHTEALPAMKPTANPATTMKTAACVRTRCS